MRLPSRRILLWTGTIAGGLVIVLLVLSYDPATVFPPLLRARPGVVVAVIGLLAAIQILNAATPLVLLGPPPRTELSWWDRLRVLLALQPLTLVAPARMSDFAALPLLKRHYPTGALASSLVMDRLATLFFLLVLAPLAVRFVAPADTSVWLDLGVAAVLLAVVSAPFLLSNRSVRALANRSLLYLWPSALEGFGAHVESLLWTSKKRLGGNLALTAAKTLLSALTLSLLAQDLGVPLDLFTAVWMSVIIQLATALPISIQGLGIAEASLVVLFTINDFPGELALSITLVSRALLLVVLAGLYFGLTLRLSVRRR